MFLPRRAHAEQHQVRVGAVDLRRDGPRLLLGKVPVACEDDLQSGCPAAETLRGALGLARASTDQRHAPTVCRQCLHHLLRKISGIDALRDGDPTRPRAPDHSLPIRIYAIERLKPPRVVRVFISQIERCGV